ncbi:zinc transporter ZupT [Brassicibacter mesophilus]|uniref:zinc transporter ZupT n=1 Tax=Brassicibacter mesophilus TaxID=745119 RepID=UPI003D25C8B9
MEISNFVLPFLLTLFAGLSTGIGGLFVLLFRKTNAKLMSIALGFSAGVMIYVSFVEIFNEARQHLINSLGVKSGEWATAASFFLGMMVIALIDRFVPNPENPHEQHKIEETNSCDINHNSKKLLKTGTLTALAITIHNFPEGIAAFISGVNQPSLGIAIALAIAIHNIPEGIAVSIPVYCATGSRKKAFIMSLLSGLSEPLGALIGYLILRPFMNDVVFGISFAAVAGIMVFISLDELLPAAREYGEHHLSIFGLIGGMVVMAVGLLVIF